MKHPKSIDRTHVRRCLDDFGVALMYDWMCAILKH